MLNKACVEPMPAQLLGDRFRRMVVRGEILDRLEAAAGRFGEALEKPDLLKDEAEIGGEFRHGGLHSGHRE